MPLPVCSLRTLTFVQLAYSFSSAAEISCSLPSLESFGTVQMPDMEAVETSDLKHMMKYYMPHKLVQVIEMLFECDSLSLESILKPAAALCPSWKLC